MIKLTRLNQSEIWLNADLIEIVEATPDSVITLVDGKKFVVRESPAEIVEAVVEYRRRIFTRLPQIIETDE